MSASLIALQYQQPFNPIVNPLREAGHLPHRGAAVIRRACIAPWGSIPARTGKDRRRRRSYDWDGRLPWGTSRPTVPEVLEADRSFGYDDTLYAVCGSPLWAARHASKDRHYGSSTPLAAGDVMGWGAAAAPRSAAYAGFVEALLERWGRRWHKSGIRYLEVWNEGDSPQFFRGTPSDLVAMTLGASRVVRRYNQLHPNRPPIKVVAPSFVASITRPSMLSGWRKRGGVATRIAFMKAYYRILRARTVARGQSWPIDVYNTHGYDEDNYAFLPHGSISARRQHLQWFGRVLHRLDLPRRPVWDTEFAPLLSPLKDSTRTRATALVMSYVDGWTSGVTHQFFYAFQDGPSLDNQFTGDRVQLNMGTQQLNRTMRNLGAIVDRAAFLGCRDARSHGRWMMECRFRKRRPTIIEASRGEVRIGVRRAHTLTMVIDAYPGRAHPARPVVRATGERHAVTTF